MKLRLDTSQVKFMVTRAPSEKTDQRGRQRIDRETQEPLWVLQVMAQDGQGGEMLNVTVKGALPKVSVDQIVTFTELEAMPYTIEGRSGVAFRAAEVKPAQAAVKAA